MSEQLISEKAAKEIADVRALLESHSIESITITSNDEAEGALKTVQLLRAKKKEIEDLREAEVAPLYNQYKEAALNFKPVIEKIDEVVKSFDTAYKAYKKRLEDEAAERQRIADEAAEKARLKAEEEARKAAEKAESYAEQGRMDKATEWDTKTQFAQSTAAKTFAAVFKPNVVQNTRGGFNTRTNYKARITKVNELLEHFKKACPPDVRAAMEKWANAQARASKGAASTIPGVTFYSE